MWPLTLLVVSLGVFLLATGGHPVPITRLTSASMVPTLYPGDVALVVPPALTGGVSVGDIVVFDGPSGWTAHRVVELRDGVALTAGDANVISDQQAGTAPVPTETIAGVIPTIGDRPVAVELPTVSVGLTEVGMAIGGISTWLLTGAGHDRRVSRLTPGLIGLLAGGFALVAWVLSGTVAVPADATVSNAGPVPLVVIGDDPTLLPPGGTVTTDGGLVDTMPGLVPPWLLDSIAGLDPVVAAIATAMITGAAIAVGTAALVRILSAP